MPRVNELGDLEITDPRAMRTLAHPVRLTIFERLQRHGPAPVAELAPEAGTTPSAAGRHLRQLAQHGLVVTEAMPLSALGPGEKATIERVPDGDGELLRYLSGLKLTPGSRIEVREAAPFEGPLTVRVGRTEHAISRELAARIAVS